ncbi:MAG TPA: hypothetical protein VGF69_17080 [Thermoanaerobaculia bacterium]
MQRHGPPEITAAVRSGVLRGNGNSHCYRVERIVMKVSIERKRPLVNKFFGGTKEADYESAMVTIHCSEAEKSTIRQNRLQERIVYEHPQDEPDYEEGQETARTHPNSYAGKHPPPRYKRSKLVGHFLEEPTQEVYDRLDTPMRFAEIQQTVENNLRELKKLMEGIQSFPATTRTFDI